MKEVYLLVWNHKHGNDFFAFSSEEAAIKHGLEIMRDNLREWGEPKELQKLSDDDLWNSWCDISGSTEYFDVYSLDIDEASAGHISA